jgi:hypothetical protein
MNAKEYSVIPIKSLTRLTSFHSNLPPQGGSLLKQGLSLLSLSGILGRIRKLFVPSLDKDAPPIGLTADFIRFYAHLGVQAHPVDLLAHGGKSIERPRCEREATGMGEGPTSYAPKEPEKAEVLRRRG